MNILNKLNISRLKNIKYAEKLKAIGKNPLIIMGSVAGLGLYLASKAQGSKKQNQSGW